MPRKGRTLLACCSGPCGKQHESEGLPLGATDARERSLADSQFGGGATTWAPASWFPALSTTTPAADGSGFTEPVGGSYARPTITNNATNFTAAVTSAGTTTKSNGTAFVFA